MILKEYWLSSRKEKVERQKAVGGNLEAIKIKRK